MKDISSSRRIERAYGEIIQLLDEVELVSLEFYECVNFEDPIDFMYRILDTYCCINPDTLRDKHQILKIESVRQDISFVIGEPLWQRFNQVIVGNEENAEFYSFAWNKVTYFFFPKEAEKMVICFQMRVDKSKLI
uniref:Uncharacterized protein n=1 Tax=Solanum tuberosum TaxID=4113 RepID=M1DXS7_SOLTU